MLEYLINSQDPEIAEKYNLRGGMGLAANQVNSLKRMFALHLEDEKGELLSFRRDQSKNRQSFCRTNISYIWRRLFIC